MTTRKITAAPAKAATRRPATKPAAAKPVAKKPAEKKVAARTTRVTGVTAKPPAPVAAKKAKKGHKKKVVRDSFTMPHDEYQKIAEIKAICLKGKLHVKKSEVLRAGLKVLTVLNAAELAQVLGSLEKIKTGRPKKH